MWYPSLCWGGVFSNVAVAGTIIPVPLQIVDETVIGDGIPRAPRRPLVITQEDNVLTLPAFDVNVTLRLIDDEGDVACTLFVPAGTTSVTLPSWLSGDYEIQLVPEDSSYYFYGYISL